MVTVKQANVGLNQDWEHGLGHVGRGPTKNSAGTTYTGASFHSSSEDPKYRIAEERKKQFVARCVRCNPFSIKCIIHPCA